MMGPQVKQRSIINKGPLIQEIRVVNYGDILIDSCVGSSRFSHSFSLWVKTLILSLIIPE